ncbi:MAG: pyridoxal-phosphate dependent enzyme, partial [Gammaproteobacteria bacterium]|nr:pyridoxal-phosphate dependent enzyme [Gammaproteobacteria bacterium]
MTMSYRTFGRKLVVQDTPNNLDHRRRVYQDITQMIANPDNPTPMVKLGRINLSPSFEIYGKMEWFNPFGSIKDRTAKYLIDGLMERGLLNGRRLVEPTSGNTGIALTAIANVKGYQTTITIPEAIPEEKQTLLRL